MINGLAVIAGATTSLGNRVALNLAEKYSHTMLLGADPAALHELQGTFAARRLPAGAQPVDLHSPDELRRVVERERDLFGRAAALVCIEADWTAGPADQLGFDEFNPETIPADCAALLAELLMPPMIRRRFGRIVLVTPCLAVRDLPETGVPQLEGTAADNWNALVRQVGRSRVTINAVAPAYSEAGPALASLTRQIRYLGLSQTEIMRFLCGCERACGGSYGELVPEICVRLASRPADDISGLCILLPLLAQQAAA